MKAGVNRAWRGWILAGAVATSIAFGGGLSTASTAFAKGYVLNPELSLTGDCTIASPDTVADPGCPEGKHPPKAFNSPRSVTTDFYGDIYVSNYGKEIENGKEGRIDVFSPKGVFITELLEPQGPKDLAVDSKGNLYVYNAHTGGGKELRRYEPSVYEPGLGKIEYGKAPFLVATAAGPLESVTVNPADDHVFFFRLKEGITEYSSAAEGNNALETFGEGKLSNINGEGLAIDEAHNRLYASSNGVIQILELKAPHTLLDTVEGSDIPAGTITHFAALAADEASGHFFIFDGETTRKAYELEFDKSTNEAHFLSTLQLEGKDGEFAPIFGSEMTVDNGPFSPNSGFSSERKTKVGNLYVPSESEKAHLGQVLTFEPTIEASPIIESSMASEITESDAELQATINPEGLETTYIFEYTTQESFEEEGFAGAAITGEGSIPVGKVGVEVSAPATGLTPETAYRFRAVAENEKGEDNVEGTFSTYPALEVAEPCPNDATRTGLSALLPDCRAYELVTPPDTNARIPRGPGGLAGTYFPGGESSPTGGKVSFNVEGGLLPGHEGTGSILGDPYLATRGPEGWSTESAGPNGVEAVTPLVGSTSPDQGYSFWTTNGPGSASIEEKSTAYVRYPDGHSALVGRGSIATDPGAEGRLISENGSHILFVSLHAPSAGHEAVQLEPNAPPEGTSAIYDRTADETTHVVSLLPENVTPIAGQNAEYLGSSLDGKGVAFKIGKKLYLRYNNEETYEIGEAATFAGVAEGGARIFYLKGGDLFAFDAQSKEAIRFTEAGNVTPVNVAAEGAAAYFVSTTALTGEEENPNKAKAQEGKENLYLSREGTISFVGVVTKRDVEGEEVIGGTEPIGGLGLWIRAAGAGKLAIDPSRVTPDGNSLLFESRADLAGYDPEGHAEVYRYDSTGKELKCLSCNPTLAAAASRASLQSILQVPGGPEPFNPFVLVHNLSAGGRRAFFQSAEPLVVNDTDGLQDVYEWEAQGVGRCKRESGCLYLISSGSSHRVDYLYAVSDNGDNVFFRSSDLLLPSDTESTPSIYDARVEGGFVTEPECTDPVFCSQKLPPPPPNLTSPTSPALSESGNLPPKPSGKSCPKGKRKITKNGATRCVKRHHKHRKAGSKKKGAGK